MKEKHSNDGLTPVAGGRLFEFFFNLGNHTNLN